MSKLDNLRRLAGGNAAESMATARPSPIPRASAPSSASAPDRMQGIARAKNAAEIPLDRIGPDPDQPREEFEPEALERLAESLRTKGQLQPIRVRWDEARGSYMIICGERRWRAAKLADLQTMQCVISEAPGDAGELLALQLIENCVREDLRPIEQAKAFRQLIDRNNWSTRQVAREIGVDQSNVVRALALLDLPAGVQGQVESGALPASTAYAIASLDDPDAQAEVADRAVAEGMSRAEVVEAVKRAKPSKGRGGKAKAKPRKTSATIKTHDGYKVTVEHRKGVDDESLVAALETALDVARSRLHGRSEAA